MNLSYGRRKCKFHRLKIPRICSWQLGSFGGSGPRTFHGGGQGDVRPEPLRGEAIWTTWFLVVFFFELFGGVLTTPEDFLLVIWRKQLIWVSQGVVDFTFISEMRYPWKRTGFFEIKNQIQPEPNTLWKLRLVAFGGLWYDLTHKTECHSELFSTWTCQTRLVFIKQPA